MFWWLCFFVQFVPDNAQLLEIVEMAFYRSQWSTSTLSSASVCECNDPRTSSKLQVSLNWEEMKQEIDLDMLSWQTYRFFDGSFAQIFQAGIWLHAFCWPCSLCICPWLSIWTNWTKRCPESPSKHHSYSISYCYSTVIFQFLIPKKEHNFWRFSTRS